MPTLAVDTNIVFSAIIKPGKVRELLFDERLKLYGPEELTLEIEELQEKMREHTNLTPTEIEYIKKVILTRIVTIVPRKEYMSDAKRALEILAETDPSDTPFIALAMYLDVPLWTGDKRLIRLAVRTGFEHYKAVDTRGVEMLLEGKEWDKIEEYLRRKYG